MALFRVSVGDADGEWWWFEDPCRTLTAREPEAVRRVLEALDQAVEQGRYAAAFFAYEAAPIFEPALAVQPPEPDACLAWCATFEQPPRRLRALPSAPPAELPDWRPEIDADSYARAIAAIREHIAAGDTYQVNFTFRLRAEAPADPWALFLQLWQAQPVPCAAWLDAGHTTILSFSPECFFEVHGNTIVCRPMKGTARRGRWAEEDEECRQRLALSTKDRAENIMIVDMVRNDLGRIAESGSVAAGPLCQIETYRTVFQMTSVVYARTRAPLSRVLQALFPSASVTGAPKVRTMEIIAALEPSPRGVYCGAVGCVAPGRRCFFNVPIRTIEIRRERRTAWYGIGGGVTWDSTAEGEYREALQKALAVMRPDPPFELLETMRWSWQTGVFLWREHLARLRKSARYFGFPEPDASALREAVETAARAGGVSPVRVRLRYDSQGRFHLETMPLPAPPYPLVRLVPDDRPTDPDSRWLYHKTTHRTLYEAARARHPQADDVVLWNLRGEVMETTIANIAARLDGVWWTPPIACGLLPGTMRARLLRRGCLRERILRLEDLRRADRLALINSVRGLQEARLV